MPLPLPVTSVLFQEMFRYKDSLVLVFADQNSKISYLSNLASMLDPAFVSGDAVFRKKRQPPSDFPIKP
jgi:hypothetical protein